MAIQTLSGKCPNPALSSLINTVYTFAVQNVIHTEAIWLKFQNILYQSFHFWSTGVILEMTDGTKVVNARIYQ